MVTTLGACFSCLSWFRVWVTDRPSGWSGEAEMPQRLGCISMLPSCKSSGSSSRPPNFAPYSEAIDRLNADLRSNPLPGVCNTYYPWYLILQQSFSLNMWGMISCYIPGKILCVETDSFPFHTWSSSFDPDDLFWRKGGEDCTFFLDYARVYFQYGTSMDEEIGRIVI